MEQKQQQQQTEEEKKKEETALVIIPVVRNRPALKQLKQDVQLDRLTSEKFVNPYDVLLLDMDATDEDIKKQYRNFSAILHPDKCKDERNKDAFFVVEQAYKTLIDMDKRKVYLRIMREARERTEYERSKENKKRVKNGQPQLPDDTFEDQYKEILAQLFQEIEEKKVYMAKLEASQKTQKIQDLENKKMLEQYKIYTEEEWETSRDQRITNWRTFSKKQRVVGTKRSDNHLRPPEIKQEERPASAPKIENLIVKPDYLMDDYKKKWK